MVLGLQGSSCRKTASVFVHQHTQGSVDGIFDWNCGCWWRVGERPVGCPRNKRGVMLTHWGRMMHICVSKLTTIGSDNSLSPPSHYLNQWWNIVNSNLRNKLQWNHKQNSSIFIQENAFENVVCEMASISSRPQWVKGSYGSIPYAYSLKYLNLELINQILDGLITFVNKTSQN